ncbi:MAG: hypothetical protein COA43_16345 [Robiginitomaculum sp.]|nr:MAG: hypothetical protein COA43_16345 [Robiginitomaculum sp.]
MAGYRSARAAATALKARPATYAAHENGSRGFGIDDARRYAKLFSVSPGWILTGEYFHDDPHPRVSDAAIADDITESSYSKFGSKSDPYLNIGEVLSDQDIFNFGKKALELLTQFTTSPQAKMPEENISVAEVFIPQMVKGNIVQEESEGWEFVAQWQFPKKYISETLKVGPNDISILVVVDDNMSPTYKIGDHLIVNFQQKEFTVEGVYFFLTEDEKIHIQNIKRVKTKFILSNDNPTQSVMHPEITVDKKTIIIHGKVCGVIAAT